MFIVNKAIATGLVLGLAAIMIMSVSPRPAAAADMKIGIVNLQDAINKSKRGATARNELNQKFERMQKELQTEEADLQKLQDELDRQGSMLSEEAKYEKQKTLSRKVRDFQDKYKDYSEVMKRAEMEMTGPIVEGLLDIANKLGKERGFALVLEAQKAGVIYFDDASDITEEVLKRFDAGK